MMSEVLVLKVLDLLEHGEGSSVEVLLKVELLVGEEVNECSLLDVVVLGVESDELHLFFGGAEVSELCLLRDVSPHGAELLGLVSGVNIVEDSELGTQEVSEVSDLDVAQVKANQVLVVENHTSEPFVV